jgi:diadenosine tetraphosphate (Ap4A) HIT family hydrolase
VGESATVWATTDRQVTCRGYVRLYAKRHVVEPFDLSEGEQSAFFRDVGAAAAAIDKLFHPVKLNYEIHGNTNPHLHLHVFPRYVGDPFEDGPIVGSSRAITHSEDEIEAISIAVQAALVAVAV